MKPGSQAYRLRAILADEEWHTTADLLREVPCIVHSRISDLRAAGYIVEHETTGSGASGSRYRLVAEVPEQIVVTDKGTIVATYWPGAEIDEIQEWDTAISPDQLALEDVA